MTRRAIRSSRWWVAAAVAVAASWGFTCAFEGTKGEQPLAEKEFSKAELYISTSTVKLEQMERELVREGGWERFFADYGREFEVFIDPRSGTASNIVGHIPMIPGRGRDNRVKLEDLGLTLGRVVREVDGEVVAEVMREFIGRNRGVLGVDPGEMGAIRAEKVTEDLWQVSVAQEVDGIPVRYGRLVATISSGNLVLIGAETWGNVNVSTVPQISAEYALNVGFNYAGGRRGEDEIWKKPVLEILPYAPVEHQVSQAFAGPVGQGYGHYLCWVFGFRRAPDGAMWEVIVDAHTGEVLAFQDTNQYVSKKVVGGVYPLTSTEICPDNARCGTMQPGYPMPFANTGFAAPNDFTNSAGLYDYSGGTLATTLAGRYVRITDSCGAFGESSATGDLDLGGVNGQHDCTSAGTSPGDTPASRSAFYEVNKLVEQARGWLPTNPWLQSQLQTNVNIALTCNAFYSPSAGTINFYRSGGGCRNTGEIAAVFDHEWGHGMDDNDAGGTLSSSSEAYADIAAIYRLQASCVGYGFFQTLDRGCGMTADGTGFNVDEDDTAGTYCALDCSGVRDTDYAKHSPSTPATPANHNCLRCGSGSGPCGKQVHCSAAPSRQAAWDFVARDLQAAPFSYDAITAFMIGNKVFYQGSGNIGSWHNCTCPSSSDGCGAANAYMQWLAADDDNGNLNDGTPHMTALFNAFNRHAIACASPAPVNSGCGGGPTAAPTLTLSPGNNQMGLSWTAVAGASKYWVLRSEGYAGCNFGKARIATVTGTSYTDLDVANGRAYSYVIVAVGSNEACFGRASGCVTGTPQSCTTPAAPAGLTATTASATQINLSWGAVAGVAGYRIFRGTISGGPYTQIGSVLAPTTTFADTTAVNGTTYYYVVRSYIAVCESANSNQASAVAGYLACIVDIGAGTNGCTGAITLLSSSGVQRVFRVNTGGFQRLDAFVDLCNPTGFSFHLGDSPTNNGFGGDAASTQHDAEAHFIGTQLAVYDDDFGDLAAVEQGVIPATGCYRVQWSAMENTLLFDNDGNPADAPKVTVDSYEGFELAPYFESDSEDSSGADANYWYVGLNRTVSDASRSGTGVNKTCFVLSATTAPSPATLSALCP